MVRSIILVVFILCAGSVQSFSIDCRSVSNQARLNYRTQLSAVVGNDEDDKKKVNSDGFIPAEETSVDYTGSVDWDAEWKKVVKNKDSISKNRPGQDFYKSDAEIAAIKAANKATEQVVRIASKVPSVPTWNELKGDWRFWIGIIAVLSIGSSLITTAATQSSVLPNNADPSSYYI